MTALNFVLSIISNLVTINSTNLPPSLNYIAFEKLLCELVIHSLILRLVVLSVLNSV